MRIFYIPNSSSSKVEQIEIKPGDCPAELPMPRFADKAAYRKWCSDPKTDHVFLSCCEGLTPVRIAAGNPPYRIHGLIGEFDTQPQGEWLADIVRNAGHGLSPLWACRSFSGNVRLIWAFKQPVVWYSKDLEQAFFKVAWSAIKPNNLVLGFVASESSDPGRYFELGSDWQCVPGGSEIADHVLQGWTAKALDKINWSREGVALPIAAIREEGERRFPGRWPGGWEKFEVGSRGCRFWDANADAMSVVVRETGCTAFTGDKPFMSWSDIFGHEYVNRLSEATIGKAIDGLWWEPTKNSYWRKLPNGEKQELKAKGDLVLHLTKRGLSETTAKGQTHSQVDDAIWAIQNTRAVAGTFPSLYHPDDTIQVNGDLLLNTGKLRLVQPVPHRVEWGEGFEVVAEFLEKLFGPEQLPFYLGWLAHFYRSCLAGKPKRGLGLFIAGGVNAGKSFLNNAIHGQLFGGKQDAAAFLTGDDKFNSHLVGSPLWTIDDGKAATDPASRKRYSQIIKLAIANDQIMCRGMYREGITVPWRGRIIVTMNLDADSGQMIPNLELSMLDKIMLLKANTVSDLSWAQNHPNQEFPDDPDVLPWLPYFAAYLRDMAMTPRVWCGNRFGTRPYHHEELLEFAEDASDTSGSKDVLEVWRRSWFKDKEDREWKGSPADLLSAMHGLVETEQLSKGQFKNTLSLGIALSKLISRGVSWIKRGHTGRGADKERSIIIARPPSSGDRLGTSSNLA